MEKYNGKINPSVITQKLQWDKGKIKEICALFEVEKFSDVLSKIPQVKLEKDENGTTYARLTQDLTETAQQTITKMEEQNMAETKHDRMQALLKELETGLYEKEEALRLALLTAIAGESIFFLGAPGCAKSMIARRIVKAFKADGETGVKYFETLLNQFTTPDEVFGNISLKALNGEFIDAAGKKIEKEEYRRLTENMLPEADIAFLDEIWKASPAILNTLLTIINERKFHNGSTVINVPLKALFTASNELPAKNRGLEALYDRLILRLPVDFINNEDSFFEMITQPQSSELALSDEAKKLQISNDELKQWKTEIDKVRLSEEARGVISALRKEMTVQNERMSEEDKKSGEQFEIGDRRWKKIVHILKTSAFLNDRSEVDLMDCQLIAYCIWSTEKQQEKAREMVKKCMEQNGLDCDTAIEEINEQIEAFSKMIDETWFEDVKEEASDKIVTVDGQECYECTKDGTNETLYVTVNSGRSGYGHDVYDSKKNYVRNNSFTKEGDSISCYHNFTVKKNPAKTHLEPKQYPPAAQQALQKSFDTERYTPLVEAIRFEITRLKSEKEKNAIPFKANLFADQSFNEVITTKLDESICGLQDAEVNLDKQRARYQ